MNLPRRPVLLVFLGAALAAQTPENSHALRWKADLEAFALRYSSGHPAPFRFLPKAEFIKRVKALEHDLSGMKDHEIAARWARIVADLGDEHTEVDFDAEFSARRLPIEIESYADGTFIVGVSQPFRTLLGARLMSVEGVPMEALRRALRPYVPFAQPGWFTFVFDESFGTWPLLMDAAGVVKVRERWSLAGVGADGQPFTTQVPLGPSPRQKDWLWEAGTTPAALRDQDPGASSFFHALLEENALYFRLRTCDDNRRRPFKAVLAQGLKAFRKLRLERFVVDLRGNTGGSENLVDQLVSALKKEPRLRGTGRILVLTDGAVFSAAAVAAWRLRHEAGALLVGEPCGAGPNHIGAVEDIHLPSGRIASFGTQVHIVDEDHPDDFRSPILPDLEVRTNHSDVLRGRDPVLAAALGMPAGR